MFCHDPKQAAGRIASIELNRDANEKHITIRPDPRLGQPGQLAHKIFVALIKKHSDYGRPIRKEISFTRREIGRLIGRKNWGGQDSEKLSRALHEIHYTFVTAHFKKSDGRYVEHSFNIFPEILLERREFASDPIEACTVTLAEPIVASLQDEHFTCLNHALMTNLGTIGQALYMRLFFHFSNRYETQNRITLRFEKRYDDLCREWLGGLTVLKHRSKIINEQLGTHLDRLVTEGFLASYSIVGAKTRDGFVLTFRPGGLFFEDYNRFYRQRRQGGLQFDFHTDQRSVGEPLRVAYLFAEKRTGHHIDKVAFVSTKEVVTAKAMLEQVPFAEMPSFIEFALAEASRTNFPVKTLGGIKQYLADYLALKGRREANRAQKEAQDAHDHAEAERLAYDRDRRREAMALFQSLSHAEQATIDAGAATGAASFNGTLRDSMVEFNKVRLTIERHGDRLKSFEQWREHRVFVQDELAA